MLDHYHTVAGTIEHRIKVERSEFLGIASSVDSDAAFSEALRGAEKRFFDATHVCWAYRIMNGTEVRAHGSDAGEPSGSAGKPILSAIEKAGLVQTTVLIVRYFGGVKLGTGGLSRAYRECARQVLDLAKKEERYLYKRIEVQTDFATRGTVYRLLSPPDVVLIEERFDEKSIFSIDVRLSILAALSSELTERRLHFVVVSGI